MLYGRIQADGNVDELVSERVLRLSNPNTMIPENPTTEQIKHLGWVAVDAYKGSIEHYFDKQVIWTVVKDENGDFVRDYVYDQLDPEVAEVRKAKKWDEVRIKRDELLLASDFSQLPDATVDAVAWATYRQSLRDITINYDDPFQVEWPVKP